MSYSSLDINTEKGQATLEQEKRAVEIYTRHHPEHTFIGTKKDSPALIDGFLVANGVIDGVVETKCRNVSYRDFIFEYGGSWLVTWEKIESASKLALNCAVPFYGFLYLVNSDCLLVQKITDEKGLFTQTISLAATETQKTVNGGLIVRNNAYINMKGAYKYDGVQD